MMRQYELVERVRRYNPNADEDLLDRAYVYAMKAHGAQTRASGDPYFSHPLEVAAILTNLKLDDATIVAALLHDTIEDTESTRAEIDQMFGPEIGAFRNYWTLPDPVLMVLVIISAILTIVAFASYMPATYRQVKEKHQSRMEAKSKK